MSALLKSHWQALTAEPLSFVRQTALAECFDRSVSAEQLAALRAASRFNERLEQRLTERLGLQPIGQLPIPDDADLAVLLLPESRWSSLPRLCGAVWHAATLSREIRSEVVNQYRQALGKDTLDLALKLRHLAGAADLLRTPAALLQAIDRDGAACLAAWLAALPEPLGAWLRLRLDPAFAFGPAQDSKALLVRSVAREIGADAPLAEQHDKAVRR